MYRLPLPVFFLLATMAASPAVAQNAPPICGSFPGDTQSYACTCEAGFYAGTIWGTNTYSTDSNICAAAQHAGAITADGGGVLAVAAPGQETYPGTLQNGITSQTWGKLDRSFMFVNPNLVIGAADSGGACTTLASGQDRITCSCAAGGSTVGGVWGSGPYTADSNICAAARHAGVIGPDGGTVTALRGPGVPAYHGNLANGVTSSDWESFNSSLIFDRN